MHVYLVLMNLKYPNYERSVNKMILIFMTLCVTVSGLRMSQVRVPQHVVRHTSARLDCQFDLEDEALYSVKWYKDGNEFYRFQPRDDPPMLVFEESGLLVDVNNSTESQVILLDVSLAASGRYRCEVSGEAPSFRTITDHGDMLVVALPESGPHITGGKPRYQVGDWASLNCSVPSSNPAALVSWFVNGEPAEPSELVGPAYVTDSRGLVTTTLGLRYKIRPKHFKKGDMKIKCLALIGTVYSRSNEESVEGDRLQKGPALESRNAVAIGSTDSRVDRVQAASIASSQTNAAFRIICSQLIVRVLVFR